MITYGQRDAICILMARGHRVSLRWQGAKRWWMLDGKPVMLAELEDQAEAYERLTYRYTERSLIS